MQSLVFVLAIHKVSLKIVYHHIRTMQTRDDFQIHDWLAAERYAIDKMTHLADLILEDIVSKYQFVRKLDERQRQPFA